MVLWSADTQDDGMAAEQCMGGRVRSMKNFRSGTRSSDGGLGLLLSRRGIQLHHHR
jgi:hypothetical protein